MNEKKHEITYEVISDITSTIDQEIADFIQRIIDQDETLATLTDTFFISSTGNNSDAGNPPSKDIISGCSISFSISPNSDFLNKSILLAYLIAIYLTPSLFYQFSKYL